MQPTGPIRELVVHVVLTHISILEEVHVKDLQRILKAKNKDFVPGTHI